MKIESIRWGIIGCGDVTEVKSGPAFQKVPGSSLEAVMRRNEDKAKDYASRHRVPRWYTDAAALIRDPEVNAIYIATPPLQHEHYTIQALEAGKPVYVEKPMAIDAAAAQRMVEAAERTGVKLSVAHYRREQPLFLKIRSLLRENAIGHVRMVNLQFYQPHNSPPIAKTEEVWRLNPEVSGGRLFYDLAPHQLDLMLYFFGRCIKGDGISLNAAKLYDADDTVSGQLLFEGNVLFNGTWCFTVPHKKDLCEIIGTEGTLRFSIFDQQPLILLKNGEETVYDFDKLPHVQEPMIKRVVEYFLGQAPNPCIAEEGLHVMQMMEEISNGCKKTSKQELR